MTVQDEIIAQAAARAGRQYRLDPPPSATEGTIDCSLFVLEVAESAGVPLPREVRTAEQIRQVCTPIGWEDVKPSDVLFFEHTYDAAGPAGADGKIASHIGISLGAGTFQMWDAHERDGADVAITDISTPYWQEKLIEARRLPALAAAAPAPPADSPSTSILRGVDVASHQGSVDWPAVAAFGIAFSFTKATGGSWYTNPTLGANWLGIKAAGLVRGAYHFAFETSGQAFPGDGPEAEADYFVAALKRAGGIETGDLLALDIEDGNGPLGDWALRWLKRVESLTGVKPFVYTGGWFSEPHGFGSVPALASYPLWLAQYQESWPMIVPVPWPEVDIHQYSGAGTVSGISGDVDLNRFNGSRADLLALGKGGAVEQPAPTADPRDERIAGLVTAVAHLADVIVPKAAAGTAQRDEALAEAQRIREQFVGPKPAA